MDTDTRRRELAGQLAALREGEALVLGEPPQRRAPTRYVQFLRHRGDHLYGECVGSSVFGGDWETTEEEHQRIRSLGWLAPGDPDPSGTQPGYPNYWVCVDGGGEAGLAAMSIGALDVLGADPARLVTRVERTR